MERERVTVQEAARQLGITESAVRKRAQRGQVPSEKVMEGKKERLYIFLDPDEDKFPEPFQERYIRSLEQRVNTLEDEVYRQQAILLNMTEAMKALSPPAQEEPSETRESPQTVEEEPERAEPRPAAGEAQEGTERPQQRREWLAPVDKLPWWHYVLGISLVILGAVLASSYWRIHKLPEPRSVFIAIMYAQIWLPSGIFGLWVGYRMRSLRLLQIIALGALVGIVSWLGWVGVNDIVRSYVWRTYLDLDYSSLSLLAQPFYLSFVPACMFYVFASLIGNAWQRRRIGRISGTTPASPVSRTRQRAAQQPRKDLTPAQQAMLGWGGTIISALLSLLGVIITVRSGGP